MFLIVFLIHKLASVKNLSFAMNHSHVINEDPRVIENSKLGELVAKGPEYIEPNRVNWKATKPMFFESTDLYAKHWCKREQVELKYISEWKDQLKALVAERI